MQYDNTKDVLIKEEIVETNTGKFRVAIFIYNEGEQKLAIQKETCWMDKQTGKPVIAWTSKTGRFDLATAKMLAVAIQSLVE
jgi:hypothetical protein